MEGMNLRNRSSFVNTYITPNLAEGYIAIRKDMAEVQDIFFLSRVLMC
jgi:hypothetical protein